MGSTCSAEYRPAGANLSGNRPLHFTSSCCAQLLQEDGKWNKFGGRLAWDKSYICNNNPEFGGTGSHKPQEDYVAAPNLDHSQERVRKDITAWMKWLRNNVGYDGWRFDFVKGYGAQC